MKLCIVTQSVDANDAILGFFNRWISEFAKHAERVEVIANRVGRHAFPPNVAVYSLGKEAGFDRLRRYVNFFRFAFRAMRQTDAIFVHMIPAWVVLLYPFAALFRKPIYLWYTHKSVTLLLRIATLCATRVFTASEESFRLQTSKKVVTGHGIDTDFFVSGEFAHDPQQLKLLAVGRLSPTKDFRFIVDVLDVCRALVPQRVMLTVVGAPATNSDVRYAADLRAYIAQKGLTAFVDFVGAKSYHELPTLYQSHDVFIHASETGSIDKVVIEAMACGMPVVTTSEAFRGMLPAAYAALRKDVAVVAGMVAVLREGKRDQVLREIVLKHHNIKQTIGSMVDMMKDG
ncbi:MAG: glycosyltransferase family 4 protein [bacterium]|nr:glycosyltransferase family 4 protein [bacterium]